MTRFQLERCQKRINYQRHMLLHFNQFKHAISERGEQNNSHNSNNNDKFQQNSAFSHSRRHQSAIFKWIHWY